MANKKKQRKGKDGSEIHPDHTPQVVALNRVIGQLERVKKMIIEREYCPDIIQQVRAARGGLVSVEMNVLAVHIENCVHEAMVSGKESEIQAKSGEIVKYVKGLVS